MKIKRQFFSLKEKRKSRTSGRVSLQPEVRKSTKMYPRKTGISSCNNFHDSLDDNDTEYYNPGCDEIFDVPQVAGLDKAWLYELYNNEESHQAKDKEDFKINPSCEDQAGRNYREPCSKGDNGYLLFSHRASGCTDMFIIPEFKVSVPEPGLQR